MIEKEAVFWNCTWHDKVELKKEHPCGSKTWEVLRVGMDINAALPRLRA